MTGSSGWLGQALVPLLRAEGHDATGLDLVPSETTDVVGSFADCDLVHETVTRHAIDAIVHAGALHKPHVATRSVSDFLETNVQGTLCLLEAAVRRESRIDRFVFTSTTSLMISNAIHAGRGGGAREAIWITEALAPLLPRNIYGVSKLSAEHLCRLFSELHRLPVVVLRTSRFFPEEDDMAHAIAQSGPNTKANELLFRRLTADDAARAHLAALERAPSLGWGTFIVSAPTPFVRDDCAQLLVDAPSVVARYFPRYRAIYERLGWTMFESIDRVYDASHAARRLGFTCRTTFATMLDELARSS